MQGHCRYGYADKSQRYMSRMLKTMTTYRRTGNAEYLLDIANYCVLEYLAPENPRFHYDPTVDSSTRKEFGYGNYMPK